MRIVLASRNEGKLAEFQSLLAPLNFTVESQAAHNVPSPEETGLTFVENALIKARAVSEATGLAALADDSGIVLPALNGAPGIYSARYAGPNATDADNNRKLTEALAGVSDRRAYFYCAIVFINQPDDPTPIISCAAWHGRFIDQPQGENGFGYDPHFYLEDLQLTSAQLPREQKNALSHRGQAVQGLIAQLRSR